MRVIAAYGATLSNDIAWQCEALWVDAAPLGDYVAYGAVLHDATGCGNLCLRRASRYHVMLLRGGVLYDAIAV